MLSHLNILEVPKVKITSSIPSITDSSKKSHRKLWHYCTLVYATGGSELLMLEVVVDIARSVVMVNATLAGADLWSNQNDIQDTQTVMKVGM